MSLEVLYVYRYKCDRCGVVHENTSDSAVAETPEGWKTRQASPLLMEDLCAKCKGEV